MLQELNTHSKPSCSKKDHKSVDLLLNLVALYQSMLLPESLFPEVSLCIMKSNSLPVIHGMETIWKLNML